MRHERILYLDGLRGVAIFMVLGCHYLTRWTDFYPYRDTFAAIATYGYFGVQLFFVVSGFVITLTLYRCASFYEFAVRRFARLWPTLALCTTLTFVMLTLIPTRVFVISPHDFIPALLFISPETLNHLTHSDHYHWMDGVCWSLVVEVRFYLLIGTLYFLQPHFFVRNLFYASVAIFSADAIAMFWGFESVAAHLEGTLIAKFLPWFLIGIALCLRNTGKPWRHLLALAAGGLVIQIITSDQRAPLAAISVAIPLMMWIGTTKTGNKALSNRVLTSIGAASYSLYLLHNNIGVTAIHWLGVRFGAHGPFSIALAIGTAVLMILVARAIFMHWETPLNRSLVGIGLQGVSPTKGSTLKE